MSRLLTACAAVVFVLSHSVLFGQGQAVDPQGTIQLSDDVKVRCVEILTEGLHSDAFWPSIHAAEGLTLGGYGDVVRKQLEPMLATKLDDQQRCGVSRELIRAGDRQKRSVMLEILAGKDDFGHIHAAESLYKVEEIGDGVAMRRAFEQTENLRLRVMAAAALGRCGNPEAMTFLRSILDQEDPEIYKLGAWVLGRIGTASDIPLLKKHLSRCPDELTRAYFDNSLAALGDPDGLKGLTKSLTSDDPAVRTYGATFAGDARAVGLAAALTKMLDDPYADARYRAAQSLLFLSRPAGLARTDDVSTLLWPATKKNPRYTEGSIVELADGALLFAVTEFQDSGSDFAKAHIVGRVSHDGGQTWGSPRELQQNTGGMNVMSVTLRRIGSGISMFYLQKNDVNDLDMFVRTSVDEGQTFGNATLVTADAGYHVINNDRVTQLSSGRLLVPAASTADVKTINHFVSHCYLSDDGGQSWRKGKGHLDAPKRGAMEPEVVELNDGRVLMIVRTQLGYIGKSYSSDGGETWSQLESLGVRAPEAPSTLRRIPSTGDLVLIFNDTFTPGAGHGGKRTPLTAAISSDEGLTWKNVGNLESDASKTFSYTSLTFVRDRAVMSYWESGEGRDLSCRFRSIPVGWFYR
ncbi:MAG: exo-alpha-sialidase [Rhodopirellula sp.]|nr:exo-alpha-sialidase [Rhodopirellula sp.]